MKKNRVQLDDLKPKAAAELTEADIALVTGGVAHVAGMKVVMGDGSVRESDPIPTESVSFSYSKLTIQL